MRCDASRVPAQDRLGCHDGGEGFEALPAEPLALLGEPAALRVGEAQASFAEVLAEDAVLFEQVFDGVALTAVHPAGHGEEHEMEGGRFHEFGSITRCRYSVS